MKHRITSYNVCYTKLLRQNEYLNYNEVIANFKIAMKEVARVYNESMNIIHYMHDKYYS